MADIQQAGRWLKEGKRVRRDPRGSTAYTPLGGWAIWADRHEGESGPYIFRPDDFLAEDWEIVED